MRHATRITILTLAVAIVGPASADRAAPQPAITEVAKPVAAESTAMPRRHPRDADYAFTQTIGSVTVYAASRTGLAMAETALTRFADAGLELPELPLWVHDTRHGCSREPGDLERSGVLVATADELYIHSCGKEFTLLHELAHAYDIGFLDDARRAAFMETRKATAWSGVEWRLAGGEHAADVIAWALLEGEVRPSRTLPNDDTSLALGFEILTSGS